LDEAAVTRAQMRDYVRRLFGLGPAPSPGSRADREARRHARLAADAARWVKHEAADAERRADERLLESELLRARLEQRGTLFPGDW
jgi:hypothetical protein